MGGGRFVGSLKLEAGKAAHQEGPDPRWPVELGGDLYGSTHPRDARPLLVFCPPPHPHPPQLVCGRPILKIQWHPFLNFFVRQPLLYTTSSCFFFWGGGEGLRMSQTESAAFSPIQLHRAEGGLAKIIQLEADQAQATAVSMSGSLLRG